MDYRDDLKNEIDDLKYQIEQIKDSYKNENDEFLKDNVSALDKMRLKDLISEKNKKEYMYLREIPENERTESQQKKYAKLVLKMRK
jgi:hypothetical protein